jgi:hypothetical protein
MVHVLQIRHLHLYVIETKARAYDIVKVWVQDTEIGGSSSKHSDVRFRAEGRRFRV